MEDSTDEPQPAERFEAGKDPRLRKRDVATTATLAMVGSVVLILGASAAIVVLIFAVCASAAAVG